MHACLISPGLYDPWNAPWLPSYPLQALSTCHEAVSISPLGQFSPPEKHPAVAYLTSRVRRVVKVVRDENNFILRD